MPADVEAPPQQHAPAAAAAQTAHVDSNIENFFERNYTHIYEMININKNMNFSLNTLCTTILKLKDNPPRTYNIVHPITIDPKYQYEYTIKLEDVQEGRTTNTTFKTIPPHKEDEDQKIVDLKKERAYNYNIQNNDNVFKVCKIISESKIIKNTINFSTPDNFFIFIDREYKLTNEHYENAIYLLKCMKKIDIKAYNDILSSIQKNSNLYDRIEKQEILTNILNLDLERDQADIINIITQLASYFNKIIKTLSDMNPGITYNNDPKYPICVLYSILTKYLSGDDIKKVKYNCIFQINKNNEFESAVTATKVEDTQKLYAEPIIYCMFKMPVYNLIDLCSVGHFKSTNNNINYICNIPEYNGDNFNISQQQIDLTKLLTYDMKKLHLINIYIDIPSIIKKIINKYKLPDITQYSHLISAILYNKINYSNDKTIKITKKNINSIIQHIISLNIPHMDKINIFVSMIYLWYKRNDKIFDEITTLNSSSDKAQSTSSRQVPGAPGAPGRPEDAAYQGNDDDEGEGEGEDDDKEKDDKQEGGARNPMSSHKKYNPSHNYYNIKYSNNITGGYNNKYPSTNNSFRTNLLNKYIGGKTYEPDSSNSSNLFNTIGDLTSNIILNNHQVQIDIICALLLLVLVNYDIYNLYYYINSSNSIQKMQDKIYKIYTATTHKQDNIASVLKFIIYLISQLNGQQGPPESDYYMTGNDEYKPILNKIQNASRSFNLGKHIDNLYINIYNLVQFSKSNEDFAREIKVLNKQDFKNMSMATTQGITLTDMSSGFNPISGGDDQSDQKNKLIKLLDTTSKYNASPLERNIFYTNLLFKCILNDDPDATTQCLNMIAMSTLKITSFNIVNSLSRPFMYKLLNALHATGKTFHEWKQWFDQTYNDENSKTWSKIHTSETKDNLSARRAREYIEYLVHLLIDKMMYENGKDGKYNEPYRPISIAETKQTTPEIFKVPIRHKNKFIMPNRYNGQYNTFKKDLIQRYVDFIPKNYHYGEVLVGGGINQSLYSIFRDYFVNIINKLRVMGFRISKNDLDIINNTLYKYKLIEERLAYIISSYSKVINNLTNLNKVDKQYITQEDLDKIDETNKLSQLQYDGAQKLLKYVTKMQQLLTTGLKNFKR